MSRSARKASESNRYHVIVRGVGRQLIFEDDADRKALKRRMRAKSSAYAVAVTAWCFMSNHVHLLLHAPLSDVARLMHDVQTAYALRFNVRHDRCGTLFQGRFTSVPIDGDAQLLQTVRYIHANPSKAGLSLSNPWSSYAEYAEDPMEVAGGLVEEEERRLVLDMLGGREAFERFHEGTADSAPCVPRSRLTEGEAATIARLVARPHKLHDIKTLEKAERDQVLNRLWREGLSVRQIGRLTSIGHNVISRAHRASRRIVR